MKIKIPKLRLPFHLPLPRWAWLGALLVVLIGAAGFYGYQQYQAQQRLISTLQSDKSSLSKQVEQLTTSKQELETIVQQKDKAIEENKQTIAAKDAEIQKRDTDIQNLNKEIQTLKNRRKTAAPKPTVGSIYDRIKVSDSFKGQVVRAIDLIKNKTPEYYKILNEQVANINEINYCGGWQLTRDINIGSCGSTYPDSAVASLIIHEAMHAYNVYVNKVYSSQTKEQELPSYQAEQAAEDRLGVPQWYKDGTAAQIAYWNSQ